MRSLPLLVYILVVGASTAQGASPSQPAGSASVRQFGAVGDGMTDDTQAIQLALDTLRKVVIPEGVFRLTNPLRPREHQEIEIVGTLKISDANIQPLTVDATAGQPQVQVRDASGYYVGQWIIVVDEDLAIQRGGNNKVRREGGDGGMIARVEGNTLTLQHPLHKRYAVASRARVATQPSAILIANSHVRIRGSGVIDANKAGQLDFAARTMEPGNKIGEETRAGCGISVHGDPGMLTNVTIEGITVRDAVLHNICLRRAQYSAISGVTSIGAHDKNIVLLYCDSCRVQGNTALRSEFEDGIILYAGNNRCLVQGNLCADNARYGIHVGHTQSTISLAGNLCVDNAINLSIWGNNGSSVGDTSVGFNSREKLSQSGVRLLGRGNTVANLTARGHPAVNVWASGTDLALQGGSIGGDGEKPTGVGLKVQRFTLDQRGALPLRIHVSGLLFSGCQTAVVADESAEDVRFTGNRFQGNLRTIDQHRSQVRFSRNAGFATENKGAVRLESGRTSLVVPHGLDVTPQLSDISVTPVSDSGPNTRFWIRQPTATGFEIAIEGNVGSAGVEFVWSVDAGSAPVSFRAPAPVR